MRWKILPTQPSHELAERVKPPQLSHLAAAKCLVARALITASLASAAIFGAAVAGPAQIETDQAAAPNHGTLGEFARCQLKSLEGPTQRSAECATFTVAENPADPTGRRIDLYVARIKSLSPTPADNPLVLIAGGPGGSAVEMYLGLSRAFSGVLDERDILLIDQRGTGRSQPLSCSVDMSSIEIEGTVADSQQAARDCLAELEGDPRFYTTSVAVQDLEALRIAAGYAQLNLYGVSYGTRVAQHFLRRYPASTRTLVIDGVVPPTLALGPNIAINAQHTLDSIFSRCMAHANCNAAFPDLQASFAALGTRLRNSPPDVSYTDPTTGQTDQLRLQYSTMALVTRLLSYAPETSALIPLTLQQAANGSYSSLTSQAVGILQNLSSTLSYGMHNSVMCSEDTPHYQNIDTAALAKTYLGAEQVAAMQAVCAEWPNGVADDNLKAPLTSDKPVLLLSGEFDPITPPAYATQAQIGLSNSHHFTAPGQGHGVIARGCIPRVVAHFVAEADIESTIAAADGCIDRQRAMPFFVNSMGPDPRPKPSQRDNADDTQTEGLGND